MNTTPRSRRWPLLALLGSLALTVGAVPIAFRISSSLTGAAGKAAVGIEDPATKARVLAESVSASVDVVAYGFAAAAVGLLASITFGVLVALDAVRTRRQPASDIR